MSSISDNIIPNPHTSSEPFLVIVRRRLAEMKRTEAARIANAEVLERAEAVHYARVYTDRANRVACPQWVSYYQKCADAAYPVFDDDSTVLSDDSTVLSDDSDDDSTEAKRYRADRRLAVLLQSARAIDVVNRKARRIALGFTAEELLAHNGAEMIRARADRELYLERAAEITRAAEARTVRFQVSNSVMAESSGVG